MVSAFVFVLYAREAMAMPCNEAADCDAGLFCVDHLCCNTACELPCEACTARKKSSGEDGICGLMPGGAVCEEPHCDGASFSFVDTSFCDAAGACIAPAGVDCLHNEPCHFDLCGGDGCTQVTKTDGSECGGVNVCTDGVCGPSMSSSATGPGGGGAGAGGGDAAGSGGAGAGAAATSATLYPPPEDGGCGCRLASGSGSAPAGAGAIGIGIAALALLRRRRVRT